MVSIAWFDVWIGFKCLDMVLCMDRDYFCELQGNVLKTDSTTFQNLRTILSLKVNIIDGEGGGETYKTT